MVIIITTAIFGLIKNFDTTALEGSSEVMCWWMGIVITELNPYFP